MMRAALFDLDGILAGTALDLGGALNTVLRRHSLPEKSITEIHPYASHGVAGLLKIGVGMIARHPNFAAWRQECLEAYSLRYADRAMLFDDVNEIIAELNRRGIKQGTITNKPMRFTDRLVPKLGLTIPPAIVISGNTCGEARPNVKPMLYAYEQIRTDPQHAVCVGDVERDMQTGRNAGMKTVLTDWDCIIAGDQTKTWPFNHHIASPSALSDLL